MLEKLKKLTLNQILPYLLVITGTIGLFSASILMIEKVALLKDPGHVLNCDINPIIACGAVINTPQASAFGFPNPILGIIGFSVVLVIGMAILAGAKFQRWFWLGLQAGVIFGIIFVTWLQFQTIYRIGALCPYCMVVWSVMIPLFWYTTLYNLRNNYLKVPLKLLALKEYLLQHHGDILVLWFLIIIGVILHHFWYFWQTLL
ncbi:MAG: Vitamin epoxide reductase [Candidatus Saccharibacteria bacterium]|nr:Vitamin epoxide reductase [Candidatus Saccharibacteria bacterium]